MNTVLPRPWLSLFLLLVWVLLNGLSSGQLVLGGLLAWLVPLLLDSERLSSRRPQRPLVLLRLVAVVAVDIVRSNVEVALRVLGSEDAIRPGFVRVPLLLRDPYAIAALASIVTMTPGTLSAALEDEGRTLLVHCFHLHDAAATVASIKSRYEAPLALVFGQSPREPTP